MTEDQHGEAGQKTFADKLNRLFELGRDGQPVSNDKVAAEINAWGGPSISAQYLWLLRTGRRNNPGLIHLDALARYFKVDPNYFFPDRTGDDASGAPVIVVLDPSTALLAQQASGLGPKSLEALTAIVEQVRKLRGSAGAF